MKKIIQVRVYKGEKYYVAECVDLPVVTQGKTLDEVAANIREAISKPNREKILITSSPVRLLSFGMGWLKLKIG